MRVVSGRTVVTVSVSQDFFPFLAKQGLLFAYLDAAKLTNRKERGVPESTGNARKTFFEEMDPGDWLLAAFDWGKTEQGASCWRELNDRWSQKLKDDSGLGATAFSSPNVDWKSEE